MSFPPSGSPRSLVIVTSTKKRDLFIAVFVGAVVLGIVVVGITGTSKLPHQPSANLLTGTIVAKHSLGEREREISVGNKGLHERETDTGYGLDVKTEPDGRVYEIPDVPKVQFEMYKVGDKYQFIRPHSEQR